MLKQVAGMENPLLEASTYSANARVVFRHAGRDLEPTTGQFVMDFSPADRVVSAKVRSMRAARTVAELFARGVMLEEDPASQAEAMQCYQNVLEMEPQHAAAHINLGTIHYGRVSFL